VIGLRYHLPLAHLQLGRLLAERGNAAEAARALRRLCDSGQGLPRLLRHCTTSSVGSAGNKR
jgi:hypothetical protein